MLPQSNFSDPVAARKGLADMLGALNADIDTSGIDITDQRIPGPQGEPDVGVRIYRPTDVGNGPGLLYIHGGGFAVGDLDTEHAGALAMARDLGITVVSVDYRLAPEHPYPAPLEDCYAALQYMHNHSGELQLDPARIAISGQSAGGGLAAGLSLLSKQRGGPAICFQFLGIPELDDRLQTVSMQKFDDTPMWSRPNAEYSWDYYLGDRYQRGQTDIPITAAPARATHSDLQGLPPTLITTMEFDPLRDEGIEFALKLLQSGVKVELHNYPGTFHGSSMLPHAAISQQENNDVRSALRRALNL